MLAIIGLAASIGIVVLAIVIGGFFVWIAAKMAHVEKTTFGRAMLAAVATSLASVIVSGLFSFLGDGVLWAVIGGLSGLLVTIWIFKSMFDTTWGKVFLIWLFQLIAIAVAVVIAAFTFGAALLG